MYKRRSFIGTWPLTALLVVLTILAASGAAMAGVGVREKMDEYLNALVSNGSFSGSVLVARKQTVLIGKGYGMANHELGVPNSVETRFRLGSVTKQFTAAAILHLQEEGLLGLDDPLKKYLPDYPQGEQISIHHLLSHTSGIPDYTAFPGFGDSQGLPTTPERLIASFRDKPLAFSPGQQYSYTNSGYVLLGYIIEKVSGRSYETYLRDHIFTPLGMTDTGYDHAETVLQNRAAGYTYRGGNELCNASYIDMSVPYAAGALYSTVKDLYLWDRALCTGKVLSRKSLAKMFTPGLGGYGYGWFIGQSSGREVISHIGRINGFSALISRFLDDDVLVVVLSNREAVPVATIASDLAAIAFEQP